MPDVFWLPDIHSESTLRGVQGCEPNNGCVCVCVRANIAYRAEQRASGPARFGRLVFWVELWSLAESKTKFALGFQSMAIQCCRSCDTSMVPKRFGINLRTWVTQQKLCFILVQSSAEASSRWSTCSRFARADGQDACRTQHLLRYSTKIVTE